MSAWTLAFYLLAGHALCDFALQPDAMTRRKNRNRPVDPASIPPGQQPTTVWPYWLGSHALIHGGMVALITGSVLLGVLETVAHFGIDYLKCANLTSIHQDQQLHLLCKIVWLSCVVGWL